MRIHAASVRGADPASTLARARTLLDLEFAQLSLEEPLHALSWEVLRPALPRESVASLRLFLPYPRSVRVGTPSPWRLVHADARDRAELVEQATRSFEVADSCGIPRVLLPSAVVESSSGPSNDGTGRRSSSAPARAAVLDSYRSILDRLLGLADRYSVKVCVTPSSRPLEVPDVSEAADCLAEFAGAPISLWIDTLRIPDGLEVVADDPEAPGLRGPDGRALPLEGVSLRDRREEREGVMPGRGEVDWTALDSLLRAAPLWLLDPGVEVATASLPEGKVFLEELDGRGSGAAPEGLFF